MRKNKIVKDKLSHRGVDTLFISVRCPCSNKCIFCSRGERMSQEESDYEEIIKCIPKYSVVDFSRIQIGGDESLNFKNIKKLIGYLKKYGYTNICIQTDGRKISDSNLLKELNELGATDFRIPLYSFENSGHDAITRIPGSFEETIKGIKNLIKLNIDYRLHTIILKQNLEKLNRLIKYCKKEFQKSLKLNLLYPDSQTSREYYKCIPKLSDISLNLLKKTKLNLPCITHNLDSLLYNFQKESRKRVGLSLSEYKKRKNKLDSCKKCICYDTCEGYYLQYFKLYGIKEFKPILS